MATLPTVADMGRRPIPAPQRAIAQVSPRAASAVADAVSALGDEASRVGFEMIDREATAEAKDRDALVSDQIRGLLYDPQGFTLDTVSLVPQPRCKVFLPVDGGLHFSETGMDFRGVIGCHSLPPFASSVYLHV